MGEIVSDAKLVAFCGLYCGACGAYRRGRCPGCHDNVKATWCKTRSCCSQDGLATCADCGQFADPNDCKKFNNFVSKLFALFFRSNRAACIEQIRQMGVQGHADAMARLGQHTIRR